MKKILTIGFITLGLLAVSGLQRRAEAQKIQASNLRTLTGRVFDRQDRPIPKAVVYLKNTKSLSIKTYITDPDGGYRFPALATNIDYEVYAEHNGAHSDTKTVSAFDSSKQVNIKLRIK